MWAKKYLWHIVRQFLLLVFRRGESEQPALHPPVRDPGCRFQLWWIPSLETFQPRARVSWPKIKIKITNKNKCCCPHVHPYTSWVLLQQCRVHSIMNWIKWSTDLYYWWPFVVEVCGTQYPSVWDTVHCFTEYTILLEEFKTMLLPSGLFRWWKMLSAVMYLCWLLYWATCLYYFR
jgi:hypothetical protein